MGRIYHRTNTSVNQQKDGIRREFAFYTLGCKVNQNETGALAQLFEQNGFTVVEEKTVRMFMWSTAAP